MEFPPLDHAFGKWLKLYRKNVLQETQVQFVLNLPFSKAALQSYEQDRMQPSDLNARAIAQYIKYPDVDAFVKFARRGRYFGPPELPKFNPTLPDLSKFTKPEILLAAEQWPLTLEETFRNNINRWGLGMKDDGAGLIHRIMAGNSYLLTLIPTFKDGCFLGGDSAISAPKTFYLSVEVDKIEGTYDSTGGIAFEEMHDNHLCVFHLRHEEQEFAVAELHETGVKTKRIIPWTHRPDIINPSGLNKFGLITSGEDHIFFINDVEVSRAEIRRSFGSRIDVTIGGVKRNQRIVYRYTNFIIRQPSAMDDVENPT